MAKVSWNEEMNMLEERRKRLLEREYLVRRSPLWIEHRKRELDIIRAEFEALNKDIADLFKRMEG